jgi:lactate permease
VVELDAIRVAALGNNAPVSFGAPGAPIIALSAVTKVPLDQLPASQWLGPYLPDIIGAVVCFGALPLVLRFWRPRETLGFGGIPVAEERSIRPRALPIVLGAW